MNETTKTKEKLGRGLSALIGDLDSFDQLKGQSKNIDTPTSGDSPGGLSSLPIKDLQPGPWQPRQNFNDAEIEKLTQSIQENGLLQPILVAERSDQKGYDIIAGERRWRASLRAKLETVPCIIKNVSDAQARLIALVENIQRENLSVIEEAEGYLKMIEDFSYTQEQIADVVGKSRSHVANLLRLLNLPKSIRGILQNGEISAGHARCLLGLSERDALLLIDEVIQKKLNVRQLEKRVQKGPKNKKSGAPARLKTSAPEAEELQKIAEDLEKMLGMRVSLTEKKGQGALTLHFKSFDELDGVLEKLSQ